MKEKDVIRDYKVQKYIFYAEKEDGSYGEVEGGSYMIENELPDFWHKKNHLEVTMREKLFNGEISPIKYYMILEEMTPTELSSRAGICKIRVKKHLTPEGFRKAKISDLVKYAKAFNVPIANFFQIVVTSTGKNPNYHFYFEEDDKKDKYAIVHTKTQNPLIIYSKIEENKR